MEDVSMSSKDVTESATASEAVPAKAVDQRLVDELVGRAQAEGLQLTGEDGLLQQLTKAVTCEGHRDILGLWAGDGGEGAEYWLHVLTEIKNRGVADVRMVVCDGLTGLPDAIGAVWPAAITQTCIVHLLRNSFRYAGRQHWDARCRPPEPLFIRLLGRGRAALSLSSRRARFRGRPVCIRVWICRIREARSPVS
jgi:Transposase, Mutator family